jgi:hypothetical protein
MLPASDRLRNRVTEPDVSVTAACSALTDYRPFASTICVSCANDAESGSKAITVACGYSALKNRTDRPMFAPQSMMHG